MLGMTDAFDPRRADHPLLILIWDNTTETILFLGRVIDPTR